MGDKAIFKLCLQCEYIADIGQINGCNNSGYNAENNFQRSLLGKRENTVGVNYCCREKCDESIQKAVFKIGLECPEEFPQGFNRFIPDDL